jgi:hypothetical protein
MGHFEHFDFFIEGVFEGFFCSMFLKILTSLPIDYITCVNSFWEKNEFFKNVHILLDSMFRFEKWS